MRTLVLQSNYPHCKSDHLDPFSISQMAETPADDDSSLSPYQPYANYAVYWRWNSSGIFTVASQYNFLSNGGLLFPFYKHCWESYAPLKYKIHTWLTLHNKLNTKTALIRKGMQLSSSCNWCLSADESINHLFVNCRATRQVIDAIQPLRQGHRDVTVMELFNEGPMFSKKKDWRSVVQALLWVIWISRNATVFNGEAFNLRATIHLWRTLVLSWQVRVPAPRRRNYRTFIDALFANWST